MDDGTVPPSRPLCWPRQPGNSAFRAPGEEPLSALSPSPLFPGAPVRTSGLGVGRSRLTPGEGGGACGFALAPGADDGRTTVPGQRGLAQTRNLWARLACFQTCREHAVRWHHPVLGTCPLPGPPGLPVWGPHLPSCRTNGSPSPESSPRQLLVQSAPPRSPEGRTQSLISKGAHFVYTAPWKAPQRH